MKQTLVISKLENKIWSALFEDDKIVELYCTNNETEGVSLGDIYVGKVKNIVNNIRGAFIEVGEHIECYYAMDENPNPIFTNKIGKKPLCIGDELLVQVSKEATKTKVPTVSSKLEFAGKYAVLTTGDTRIGVSSKIGKVERERLLSAGTPFANDAYGIIIRTNAKEVEESKVIEEIKQLTKGYEALITNANTRLPFTCLKKGKKQYLTKLLDIYQNGQMEIIVEDLELYEEIQMFLRENHPEDLECVILYQDESFPLYKLYSLETHIEHALKERVWLKSGGYLVIQPTEALTVIDVNTGKCVSKKNDDLAKLKLNLEAAVEVARQIRLRNLSGIILVDFINLESTEMMETLLEALNKELKKDPISTTLVDVTKLQLVEITRKKVRKPLHETVHE